LCRQRKVSPKKESPPPRSGVRGARKKTIQGKGQNKESPSKAEDYWSYPGEGKEKTHRDTPGGLIPSKDCVLPLDPKRSPKVTQKHTPRNFPPTHLWGKKKLAPEIPCSEKHFPNPHDPKRKKKKWVAKTKITKNATWGGEGEGARGAVLRGRTDEYAEDQPVPGRKRKTQIIVGAKRGGDQKIVGWCPRSRRREGIGSEHNEKKPGKARGDGEASKSKKLP